MKKNRILKKFLYCGKERFRIGIFLKLGIKKLFDIPQQMNKTFLFCKRWNFASVGIPEIGNENSVVKLPEMIGDDLGAPTFHQLVGPPYLANIRAAGDVDLYAAT